MAQYPIPRGGGVTTGNSVCAGAAKGGPPAKGDKMAEQGESGKAPTSADGRTEFVDDGNGGFERAKGAYSSKKHVSHNVVALGVVLLIVVAVVVISAVTGAK